MIKSACSHIDNCLLLVFGLSWPRLHFFWGSYPVIIIWEISMRTKLMPGYKYTKAQYIHYVTQSNKGIPNMNHSQIWIEWYQQCIALKVEVTVRIIFMSCVYCADTNSTIWAATYLLHTQWVLNHPVVSLAVGTSGRYKTVPDNCFIPKAGDVRLHFFLSMCCAL